MVYVLQKVLGAGWLLAGVCLAAPILAQHKLFRDNLDTGSLEWINYMTLARIIWPLGISWVIFVCVSGYGGMYSEGCKCY
jgi:ABC-type transport system involved in cytochrome c biogenesis permease component